MRDITTHTSWKDEKNVRGNIFLFWNAISILGSRAEYQRSKDALELGDKFR